MFFTSNLKMTLLYKKVSFFASFFFFYSCFALFLVNCSGGGGSVEFDEVLEEIDLEQDERITNLNGDKHSNTNTVLEKLIKKVPLNKDTKTNKIKNLIFLNQTNTKTIPANSLETNQSSLRKNWTNITNSQFIYKDLSHSADFFTNSLLITSIPDWLKGGWKLNVSNLVTNNIDSDLKGNEKESKK